MAKGRPETLAVPSWPRPIVLGVRRVVPTFEEARAGPDLLTDRPALLTMELELKDIKSVGPARTLAVLLPQTLRPQQRRQGKQIAVLACVIEEVRLEEVIHKHPPETPAAAKRRQSVHTRQEPLTEELPPQPRFGKLLAPAGPQTRPLAAALVFRPRGLQGRHYIRLLSPIEATFFSLNFSLVSFHLAIPCEEETSKKILT